MERKTQVWIAAGCAAAVALIAAFYGAARAAAAAPAAEKEPANADDLVALRRRVEALERRLGKVRVDKDGILHAETIHANSLRLGGDAKAVPTTFITAGWITIEAAGGESGLMLAADGVKRRRNGEAWAAAAEAKVIYAARLVLTKGTGDEERMLLVDADGLLFEGGAEAERWPTYLRRGQLQLGSTKSDRKIQLNPDVGGSE